MDMETSDMDLDVGSGRELAGLAADDRGTADARPPLVLLHGLTFDRRMWRPALDELDRLDPGRRSLAFDLPGHGRSPASPSYTLEGVAAAVHRAVEAAGLSAPVVVGHSMSAVVASIYATRYSCVGVVNVDQPLQVAPFANLVKPLADRLRGPDFADVWVMFMAGMHAEVLPASAQELVRSMSNPSQELVLGYWQQVLKAPAAEVADMVESGMRSLGAAGRPYLVVAGDDPGAAYREWLHSMLPQATISVLAGSGHFPHLAHPDQFAERLAATAAWGGGSA